MNSFESDIMGGHVAPTISNAGSGSQSSVDNPTAPAGLVTGIEGLIEDHILPKLDPEFVQYFSKHLAPIREHDISIEQVRAHPEAYQTPCALDTSGYPRVHNSSFISQDDACIPVRVYYPDPVKHGPGQYPAHLNFHGGGFVLGNLDSESALCLNMREAGVVVVDVGYRLCPETVWGKCIEDAWDALNWVRQSASDLLIDTGSISIGGISAGGHISLVLQHRARDAGIPLKLCMASVSPATDALAYRFYTESPFPSFHEFYRGPVLPWKRIKYFGNLCMPQDKLHELRQQWPDWWFAPLRARNWDGLCDTLIRTAEVDPLRDEGEAYATKLIAGGNKVTIKRYLGCPHTFMYLDCMMKKHQYDEDTVAALRAAHAPGS
ncbi:Alpha/beta hydrolase fold-3 domain-containing protein [Madurella fahalii]|uniref:Alpha/beta hydrolase fold-3 domain-containing protein n=1 Tax=Madurella fahalii TaxID=1157608 RepID=A0ABQ0GPZ3_9PEZI